MVDIKIQSSDNRPFLKKSEDFPDYYYLNEEFDGTMLEAKDYINKKWEIEEVDNEEILSDSIKYDGKKNGDYFIIVDIYQK